jgi:hypothetical protein
LLLCPLTLYATIARIRVFGVIRFGNAQSVEHSAISKRGKLL